MNTYFANKLSYEVYISGIEKDVYDKDDIFMHAQSTIDQVFIE